MSVNIVTVGEEHEEPAHFVCVKSEQEGSVEGDPEPLMIGPFTKEEAEAAYPELCDIARATVERTVGKHRVVVTRGGLS